MPKNIIIAIIVLVGIASILGWSSQRDEVIAQQADKYVECVKVEYGTTPSQWYAEHNYYPECNK